MTNFNKTKYLSARVSPETHREFLMKSRNVGKPSDVLRSLIVSFINSTVKPNQPEGTLK